MRAAYLTRQGATLGRQGELLVLRSKGEEPTTLPIFDLEQLVVVGSVTLTPPALDLLLQRDIDVVLLSGSGRYRGRVGHATSTNVRLRLRQLEVLRDDAWALAFAKSAVDGKLHNARTMLRRHARRHERAGLEQPIAQLGAAQLRLGQAGSLDEVRGCEGRGAAVYFGALPSLLAPSGMSFPGRVRRPPTDPVNAALSFGYTLLTNAVEAAVQVVGLDPYVGALHAVTAGRPSLVLDLVEEHRTSVVDALVVAAFNQRALTAEDFDLSTPDEGVYFTPTSLKRFVRAFERRLDRSILYEAQSRKLPWRQVIVEQVRGFARAVLERGSYEPLRLR